jgi:uncharacterized membrane protein
MENRVNFIKATSIGGIIFLIPLGIIVLMIGKLAGVMKTVASKLTPFIPVETPQGAFVLNLLALAVLLGLCFLAGLVAQRATARKLSAKIESVMLEAVPGYSFVKGFADNIRQSDELSESFIPVIVQFDDYSQIAFEIEHQEGGKVVIYLPGAPNPWSGTVVYVTPDRVRRLPMNVSEVVRSIRKLGKGSVALVERSKFDQELEASSG